MTIFDAEISGIAADFWKRSGVKASFPRILEPAVFVVLPLAVVRLPHLRLRTAIEWLGQRGIAHRGDTADRPLHGYLIARGGMGVVFLDGSDSPDELRFSEAHEIAHFFYDYLRPRMMAVRSFGQGIEVVLDGLRAPTPEERLAGVLRGIPLGTYSHIGRRSNSGTIQDARVLEVEDKADQLALELLAPVASVTALLRNRVARTPQGADRQAVAEILRDYYGLPWGIAEVYSRIVLSNARSSQSFRDWLGP